MSTLDDGAERAPSPTRGSARPPTPSHSARRSPGSASGCRATPRSSPARRCSLRRGSRSRRGVAARTLGASAPARSRRRADARFADPTWESNPAFYALRQCYLLFGADDAELAAAAKRRGARRQGRVRRRADGRRARADELPARQPRGTQAGLRDRRRERRPRRHATSSTTSPRTAAGRGRSTRASSSSARTWRRRRARSSTATG